MQLISRLKNNVLFANQCMLYSILLEKPFILKMCE